MPQTLRTHFSRQRGFSVQIPSQRKFLVLLAFLVLICALFFAFVVMGADLHCKFHGTCALSEGEDLPSIEATPSLEPDESLLAPPRGLSLRVYLAMVRTRAQPLVVSLTNQGYADMASNFLCSLKRLNVTNTLTLATDLPSYSYLARRGYEVFFLNGTESSSKGATWGSPAFNKFVKQKVLAVATVVGLGYDVFFCDLDMVWMRSVYEILPQAARRDELPIIDGHSVGSLVGPPNPAGEGWDYAIFYYKAHSNTGFYYMRSNNRTIKLMRNWVDCGNRVSVDDQDTFDGLTDHELRGKRVARIRPVLNRCSSLRTSLRRVLLTSKLYFPCGSDFFVLRYPQRARVTPVLVHANQIPGGKRAKIKVMQEHHMWLVNQTLFCTG
eukprot:RCo005758